MFHSYLEEEQSWKNDCLMCHEKKNNPNELAVGEANKG